MALSRGTAAAIVAAVQADAECRRVITSPLGAAFGGTGWAGGLRNLGYIAGNAAKLFAASYAASVQAHNGQPVAAGRNFNQAQAEIGTIISLKPTDEQSQKVCSGIAEATAAAINAAVAKQGAASSLALVRRAESFDRMGTRTTHVATGIWMRDRSFYVLDWHATLRVDDPMVYGSSEAFTADDGTLFSLFRGF